MSDTKPRGYFKNVLVFDCETTGIALNSLDPTHDEDTGKTYQMVSAGFIIADIDTLKPLDELYVEIQWNGESEWTLEAQKVHGLTKEYLEKEGLTELEAVEEIGSFLITHFGPENCIHLLGHNVATFDRYFLARLFEKFGIGLNFGNRHIDTYSLGVTLLGAYNSDDLFSALGLGQRDAHNALEDVRLTLAAARRIQKLFGSLLS